MNNERSATHQGAEGAKLFFQELLDSVQSLGAVADEHGLSTLTDLMYLQNAILVGGHIDLWPGATHVSKVLETLPSAQAWLSYTKLAVEVSAAIEPDEVAVVARTLPDADDFPSIVVGHEYEFYSEMQDAELPAHERLRNYTGQKVLVISGPKTDPNDDPESSDYFVVRAADGREFTAAEEELNGWDKALGQFFWPDGTYGKCRDRQYLVNEQDMAPSL